MYIIKMSKKKAAIKNKKRKQGENLFYYFVGFIEANGDVTPLLLTKKEIQTAKKRALKNKEDVPSDFLIFQISPGSIKEI